MSERKIGKREYMCKVFYSRRQFDKAMGLESIMSSVSSNASSQKQKSASLFREPFMDYSNLLALTGYITQSREDVEQMYRRMLFNYLTDNKDDHCKNFSFYVIRDYDLKTWRWRIAPAYDLTLCTEGYNGEHATFVNGTGHPRLSDFIAVGRKIKLSEDRCRELIEEV